MSTPLLSTVGVVIMSDIEFIRTYESLLPVVCSVVVA
jgi:hypothetical protein